MVSFMTACGGKKQQAQEEVAVDSVEVVVEEETVEAVDSTVVVEEVNDSTATEVVTE